MAIELVCGQCQGRFLAEVPGSIVACPHCGVHLQTPGSEGWSALGLPETSGTDPAPLPIPFPATTTVPDAATWNPPPPPAPEQSPPASEPVAASASPPVPVYSDPEATLALDNPIANEPALAGDSAADAVSLAAPEPFPADQPNPTESWITEPASAPETWMGSSEAAPDFSTSQAGFAPADAFAPTAIASVPPPQPGDSPALAEAPTQVSWNEPVTAEAPPLPSPAAPVRGGVSPALFVLVLSLASAMTLAAAYLWMQLQGQVNPYLESLPDVPPVKDGAFMYWPAKGAMNPLHTLRLGESQRYGSVRVTPVQVVREPVEFVYFEPKSGISQPPSAPVLKLYLRFENVSHEQTFAPLDQRLVFKRMPVGKRDVYKTNNFVCNAAEKGILDKQVVMYPLNPGDVWDLRDQKLGRAVRPGETYETFLATAEDGLERLSGELLWRVHFRKGYNPETRHGVTTLIEVAFNSSEIVDPSQPPAPETPPAPGTPPAPSDTPKPAAPAPAANPAASTKPT